MPGPLALIAEITHRCPLHCVYCSNPLQMTAAQRELATEDWVRVFQQAAKLGVLHLHLTGGEPLARPDLTELVAAASQSGLYSNLITSGLGMTETRLQELDRRTDARRRQEVLQAAVHAEAGSHLLNIDTIETDAEFLQHRERRQLVCRHVERTYLAGREV